MLVSLLSHGSVLFVQKLKRDNLFLWFDLYLESFMFTTTSQRCQLIFMKILWFHPSWLCLICSMRQGPNYWIQILSWLKIITALTIFTSTGPLPEYISWASHLFKKRELKWDLLLPPRNNFSLYSFFNWIIPSISVFYSCFYFYSCDQIWSEWIMNCDWREIFWPPKICLKIKLINHNPCHKTFYLKFKI